MQQSSDSCGRQYDLTRKFLISDITEFMFCFVLVCFVCVRTPNLMWINCAKLWQDSSSAHKPILVGLRGFWPSRWEEVTHVGAASEEKAGICSLSLWPGLPAPSAQYGSKAHLTQNNILTDGEPSVISPIAAAHIPGICSHARLSADCDCSELFTEEFLWLRQGEKNTHSKVKGQNWLLCIPGGRLNLSQSSQSIDQCHLSLLSGTSFSDANWGSHYLLWLLICCFWRE